MPVAVLPHTHGQPGSNARWEAISNELIFNHIIEYLTHNELKKTLLACKLFLQKIRLNKGFQNASIVRLKGSDFCNKHFNIFNNQILIWKFIDINIDVQLNTFKCHPDGFAAKKRFQHTEFLSIFLLHTVNRVLELKCEVLPIILASSFVLKSLTLQDYLLGHGVFQLTLDNPLVQIILRNLEELYISSARNSLDHLPLFQGYSKETLESNVRKFGSISTHLKRLKWSPGDEHLADLLQTNASTLNSLCFVSFHSQESSGIESIKEIPCPKLRELKIMDYLVPAGSQNFGHLIRFLEQQPPLINLELKLGNVTSELLRTVSKVHGDSLKKFKLFCYDPPGNSGMLRNIFRMKQLEALDFSMLWSPAIDYYSVPSVLKALPKALTQLTLRGFYYGKWNRICEHICSECPDYCNCESKCGCLPVSPAEANIAQLRQFVNLTKLTVASLSEEGKPESACMMDDPMLQLIIQYLKKLKSLRFGRCERLTDFGLTGCLPDGRRTGVGINELNELRELGIVDCPLVTNPALLAAIKFPRLASLCLITPDWRPSSSNVTMVRGIVEQNPCLTAIRIHLHPFLFEDIESSLKAANPALANVLNAHMEGCGCVWGFHETTLYRTFFGDWKEKNSGIRSVTPMPLMP